MSQPQVSAEMDKEAVRSQASEANQKAVGRHSAYLYCTQCGGVEHVNMGNVGTSVIGEDLAQRFLCFRCFTKQENDDRVATPSSF